MRRPGNCVPFIPLVTPLPCSPGYAYGVFGVRISRKRNISDKQKLIAGSYLVAKTYEH